MSFPMTIPAESISPAASQCTLEPHQISVREYILFQTLLSKGALGSLGGIRESTNLLPSETTEAWRLDDSAKIFTAVMLAYDKIVGVLSDTITDVVDRLVAAIGRPHALTRGHMFALFRLLVHYRTSNLALTPLCTEYIQTKSYPEGKIDRIVSSQSDPCVPNFGSVSAPTAKRRRKSDVGLVDAFNMYPTEVQLEAFSTACADVRLEIDFYSSPEWHTLPFPLAYPALPRTRFQLQPVHSEGETLYETFEFMGREAFPLLAKAVDELKIHGITAAFLEGPIGVGKSHLLAALALYLRRQGKLVVYIPHCGALVNSPVEYMAAALLCAFHGAKHQPQRAEIRTLRSMTDIEDWCANQYRTRQVLFYFIVDQLNGLQPNKDGRGIGHSNPLHFYDVQSFLLKLYINHICVRSSSPNDQHGYRLFGRGQEEVLLRFSQVLTEAESISWINHFRDQVPSFENEAELAFWHDYTGRILLFYAPLLGHGNTPLSQAWPEILASPIFCTARDEIRVFAARSLANEDTKSLYLKGLEAALTGTSASETPVELFDHRFCHVHDGGARITCGFARTEITAILEREGGCDGMA
ncbi:hypothetical protein K438DRAFT_1850138 [Mycena galopus ATCC 62051]|nr:hypothetical protein K438DRAFT_1850138 [Mycena galopus ATCC 62051]